MNKKKLIILSGLMLLLGGTFLGYWLIMPRSVAASSDLRSSILTAPQIQVHEGLPHQFFESESLERELAQKKTVQFDEFPFYTPALNVSESQREALVTILSANESIRPFIGEKLCGGFHPDFAVSWSANGSKKRALICFGCGEIIFTSGTKRFRYDLVQSAEEELKRIFHPLGKNRLEPINSLIPPEWLEDDIAKVVGYRFVISGEDAKGNHPTGNFSLRGDGPIIVEQDRLSELKKKEVELTAPQIDELLNLVFCETEAVPQVACYSPHQVFIFYDREGIPKRLIEICFLCNGLMTSPYLPEFQWKRHDFTGLAHFCDKLGLWAPYSKIENYAPWGTDEFWEKLKKRNE